MINFIVYNSDGDILRTGLAPESQVDLQAGDGEFVMRGMADDSKHKIVDGEIVDKPVATPKISIDEIRYERNTLIAKTDWTQIPDAPLTDEKKAQYRAYRQALRDLPSKYDTITDIAEVNFPTLEDY